MSGLLKWHGGKESACQCRRRRRRGFSSRVWKIPGEGHGNPLQDSCLENPTDKGDWWAAVHGVAKSWTYLSEHTQFI